MHKYKEITFTVIGIGSPGRLSSQPISLPDTFLYGSLGRPSKSRRILRKRLPPCGQMQTHHLPAGRHGLEKQVKPVSGKKPQLELPYFERPASLPYSPSASSGHWREGSGCPAASGWKVGLGCGHGGSELSWKAPTWAHQRTPEDKPQLYFSLNPSP